MSDENEVIEEVKEEIPQPDSNESEAIEVSNVPQREPDNQTTPARSVDADDKEGEAGNEESGKSSADVIAEHNKQVQEEKEEQKKKSDEELVEEARLELEALQPTTHAVRRLIGKPPEHGGKETEYAVYVQEPMPYMARAKFYSLVTRTISEAIKATGGEVGNLNELMSGNGSLLERSRNFVARDISDAAGFMALIFELMGEMPDFLTDCYMLWLDVPRKDYDFAKYIFHSNYDPENNKWGLKDEVHVEILETFIDQNYENIRQYFLETLPGIVARASLHERSKNRKPLGRA